MPGACWPSTDDLPRAAGSGSPASVPCSSILLVSTFTVWDWGHMCHTDAAACTSWPVSTQYPAPRLVTQVLRRCKDLHICRANVCAKHSDLMHRLNPRDYGVPPCEVADLKGGDAPTNAAILRDTFGGQRGAVADALCLNAGVALAACGVAPDAGSGIQMAQVSSTSAEVLMH